MIKFIIGLMMGVGIAGGLAFYLNVMPNQFESKHFNKNDSKLNSKSGNPVIFAPDVKLHEDGSGSPVTDSANYQNKNKDVDYDFYDILQELQGKKSIPTKMVEESQERKANNTKLQYYIQAGAFSTRDMALDMSARVALLGFDSKIISQKNKGIIIHRILLGPFQSQTEAVNVINQLSDNGIQALLFRTQN